MGMDLAICSYSFRSASVRGFGVTICRVTNRSPGGRPGMPLPLSLSRLPVSDPGGTVSRIRPARVSTVILSPRAASQGVTGTVRDRSRPLRT